jgi:hypothetical protein
MIGDERDDMIERVRSTLTPLPETNPRSVARILAAVAHETSPQPAIVRNTWLDQLRFWLRTPTLSLGGAGALAMLALTVGFLARGEVNGDKSGTPQLMVQRTETAPVYGATPSGSPELASGETLDTTSPMGLGLQQPVLQWMEGGSDENAPVPVRFVFEGKADRVSLVGDFNAWTVDSTPMRRAGTSEVWVVTLPVTPGRHTYSFVIDGTQWVADPTAPAAPDSDFGKPGSVILVGPK